MPDAPEELLTAVRDQADARVRMDIQVAAKYLTPEAVDSLRASFSGIPPRVGGYEIEKHEPRGSDHIIDVRYSAADHSFVIRCRWRELENGWMAVHAERLWEEGDKRPGILSRFAAAVLRPLAALRRR